MRRGQAANLHPSIAYRQVQGALVIRALLASVLGAAGYFLRMQWAYCGALCRAADPKLAGAVGRRVDNKA